ncbi:MAG: hypothetical protein PWQ52_1486 [Methanolobus sp.]|nr:hypothetical protein [Methanolobus sp.]
MVKCAGLRDLIGKMSGCYIKWVKLSGIEGRIVKRYMQMRASHWDTESCLSGGIDSSSIVVTMRKVDPMPA